MQAGFSRRRFLQSLGSTGAAGSMLGTAASSPAAAYDSRSAPLISSSMAGSPSGFVHPQKVCCGNEPARRSGKPSRVGTSRRPSCPPGPPSSTTSTWR